MKSFFVALVASLSIVLLSSVAEAGGGSKNNGQIVVRNRGSGTLVVFLSAGTTGNNDVLGLDPNTPVTGDIQTQFNTSGGRTVGAGGQTTFTNLVAGDYTLTAEFLNGTGANTTTGTATTQTVHVNKGQTVTVTFTGNSSAEPTITVSPVSAGVNTTL